MSVRRIALALFFVFVGMAFAWAVNPRVVVPVESSVTPAQIAELTARWRMRTDGLRARLEGVQVLKPDTVYVTDTLVTPPDTVYSFVSVRDGVVRTVALLPSPIDSLRTPVATVSRFGDCDDGLEVSESGVVCDPARLGHLWAGPVLSRSPALSVWWRPSYRSPWEASLEWIGGDRWDLRVRRGLRIF